MSNTDAECCIQTTEQTLLAFCRRQGLFACGARVIAACSGGADSMAMLRFLLRCRGALGITVLAAHVDHGIRGEASRADAAFVAAFCKKNNVPLFLYDAAAQGTNIPANPSEAWARTLRYTWFDRLAAEQNAVIATAHTLSDQMETVLFRAARGTGLHGLCGIPAVRGVYRRPCLCLTRADTVAYCRALGQDYVQDETNLGDAYARNRIRHHAVPALEAANPAAAQAFGRLCGQMQELDAWLNTQAAELLQTAEVPGGYDLAILRDADGPVLAAALRALVACTRDPEEKYVAALRAAVCAGQGSVPLTPQVCWQAGGGVLAQMPSAVPPAPLPLPPQRALPGAYTLPGGYRLEIAVENYEVFLKNPSFFKKDYTSCADYAKIDKNIFLRTRLPGDTYRPAGRGVGKSLKKYLNEAKIPAQSRALLPLLASGSRVLWLWGAGFADGLAPDAATQTVLLVRAWPKESGIPQTDGGMDCV